MLFLKPGSGFHKNTNERFSISNLKVNYGLKNADIAIKLVSNTRKLKLNYYCRCLKLNKFQSNGSIQDVDYLDTWKGLMEAKNLGLTRSIGVSNFNIEQLKRLIDSSGVKPAVLQIEVKQNSHYDI